MNTSDSPTVNPNYGGRDRDRAVNDPEVNPNYGGERQPHPHNDPEVNPNYGGEDVQRGDPTWREHSQR